MIAKIESTLRFDKIQFSIEDGRYRFTVDGCFVILCDNNDIIRCGPTLYTAEQLYQFLEGLQRQIEAIPLLTAP